MFKHPFFSLQLLFLLSELVLGYSGKQAVAFFIIGHQGKISVMGAGSHPPFPAHKGSEASSTHRLSSCVGTHNILKMIRHMWFWPCQRQSSFESTAKGTTKKDCDTKNCDFTLIILLSQWEKKIWSVKVTAN